MSALIGTLADPNGPRFTETSLPFDARANAMRAIRTSVAASANPPRTAVIDISERRPRCARTYGAISARNETDPPFPLRTLNTPRSYGRGWRALDFAEAVRGA